MIGCGRVRVLAFAAALSGCGAPPPSAVVAAPGEESVGAQVVGGKPVNAATYPATGALVSAGSGAPLLVCTATLIAPRALLTAAHCIDDPLDPPSFTLGASIAETAPASRLVTRRAYLYPGFDLRSTGSLHDIAVVELDEPLTAVTPESTATPNASDPPVAGESVELVGYGSTSAAGSILGVKNAARTTIASVRPDEMTIGALGQAQDCFGDSGGPSFVVGAGGMRRLVGVTSRSASDETSCTEGTIHTRVDAYADWIASTLSTIAADDRSSRDGCAAVGATGADARTTPAWLAMCALAAWARRRRPSGRRQTCWLGGE